MVQNIPGGNAPSAVPLIAQFCAWAKSIMPELPPARVSIDWKQIESNKQLPPELAKRLRSLEASLKALEPRTAAISDQVESINSAYTTAQDLPATQAELREALEEITTTKLSIEESWSNIVDISIKSNSHLLKMNEISIEANKTLEQVGDAYRAVTTKGLAASFSKKAAGLNISVYFWVFALAGALLFSVWMNAGRFDHFESSLASTSAMTGKMWIELILLLLGVGGPVWFGWVATKQIGQRFRLAEDYAFKASVAKAYEGYRLEAVKLDKNFEHRLFASALTRLEEEPLRLVENQSHPQTQGKIERWHQTMKNRILLENYYLPGDLEAQIEAFVQYYNNHRYHESLGNVTPADAYFGRAKQIHAERARIKRQTIEHRRLQHRKLAA